MGHKKVPVSSVRALTLRANKKAAARRTEPVPQLTCLSGPCQFAPSVVQCTNVGDDGAGPQWKCEADLPEGIKFGSELEVVCEGWARAGDSNILAGSCALEYELQDSRPFTDRMFGTRSSSQPVKTKGHGYDAGDYMFFALYAFVAFFILRGLYRAFTGNNGGTTPRRPGGGWGGWGGGGGGGGGGPGGGWGPPPPPYTKDDPTTRSSGPGFWTGLAAGAAGSHLLNRATQPRQPEPSFTMPSNPGPSRWMRRDDDDQPGPSRRTAGFGGTRTR